MTTSTTTPTTTGSEPRGRSPEQLLEWLEQFPGVYWTTDAALRLTAVGGAGLRDQGLDPDQMVGMWVGDLPYVSASVVEIHRAAVEEGREGSYEIRYGERDFTARVRPLRVPDGSVVGAVGSATDVTERVRAEAELRARERELATLTEHAPDIIVRFDRELRHLYISPAVEVSTGFPPEHYLGKTNRELAMPEELCRLWEQELNTVFESGEPRRFAFEWPGPTGARWFEASVVPELAVDGSVQTVLSATRDSTEMRRAEKERAASERRYRELFELASTMIFLFDTEARIVDANPVAAAKLGYSREELVGMPLGLIVETEEVAAALGRLERKLNGSESVTTYETNLLTRDGRRIPVEVTSQVTVKDGIPSGAMSLVRDLSERRAARHALEESERRFRSAFDDAPVGMVLTNPDATVLRANAAFAGMLGYADAAELVGVSMGELLLPEDEPGLAEHIRVLRDGIEDRAVREKRYRRADGETVVTHVAVSPVREHDGTLRYFVLHAQDITEVRSLEERYQRAQRLEAVGKLAGGVSHDFNNLLTVIQAHGQFALQKARPLDRALADDVERLLQATDRAAELTQQLLAFSRRQVMQPKVVDLRDTVSDIVKLLQRLIGEDITLATRWPGEPVYVCVDRVKIEQVIANLAVNAREAMPNGGSLTVEVACGDPHNATLTVSDSGVGMSEETLARIFDPFFTTKEHGTGLGLATVHGIVTQSGGEISVESRPGHGTTFTIALPLSDTEPAIEVPSTDKAACRGGGNILLVEDNPAVRLVVERMLEASGYTVTAVADGDTAIATAETRTFDLLVTDLVMSGVTGRETAEAIADHQPDIKVLYMSGHTDDQPLREGPLAGRAGFIHKPFSGDNIARAAHDLLVGN